MAGKLPPITLECHGCGHQWPTGAIAGASIRCPRCRRGRRVPAGRPRTVAQARAVAAADDDGLGEAWAAELPLDPGTSGQHAGRISAAARQRGAEHLAAIDRSAARQSAQLADPGAERRAAETLAAERAELLDALDALAELLDTREFPRDEPYALARRVGIRYRAVALLHADRAGHAETLDQLARARAEAEAFAASIGGWLDQIADLGDDLDGQPGPGRVIPGYAEPEPVDGAEPAQALPPGAAADLLLGHAAITLNLGPVAALQHITGRPVTPGQARQAIRGDWWAAYDQAAAAAARPVRPRP